MYLSIKNTLLITAVLSLMNPAMASQKYHEEEAPTVKMVHNAIGGRVCQGWSEEDYFDINCRLERFRSKNPGFPEDVIKEAMVPQPKEDITSRTFKLSVSPLYEGYSDDDLRRLERQINYLKLRYNIPQQMIDDIKIPQNKEDITLRDLQRRVGKVYQGWSEEELKNFLRQIELTKRTYNIPDEILAEALIPVPKIPITMEELERGLRFRDKDRHQLALSTLRLKYSNVDEMYQKLMNPEQEQVDNHGQVAAVYEEEEECSKKTSALKSAAYEEEEEEVPPPPPSYMASFQHPSTVTKSTLVPPVYMESREEELLAEIPYNEDDFFNAAQNPGNMAVLKDFIERGFDPNAHSKSFKTALHHVAHSGNVHAAIYLLDKGADPRIPSLKKVKGVFGTSEKWLKPSEIASKRGHLAMKELLIQRENHLNAQDQFDRQTGTSNGLKPRSEGFNFFVFGADDSDGGCYRRRREERSSIYKCAFCHHYNCCCSRRSEYYDRHHHHHHDHHHNGGDNAIGKGISHVAKETGNLVEGAWKDTKDVAGTVGGASVHVFKDGLKGGEDLGRGAIEGLKKVPFDKAVDQLSDVGSFLKKNAPSGAQIREAGSFIAKNGGAVLKFIGEVIDELD